MSPSALGLTVAALLAAPEAQPARLADLGIPLVQELLAGALPAPPDEVQLRTIYFGTVTVNHPAHLKRQVSCKDCHGPGRAGPLELTPRVAHERCRGCHVDRKRGPTECRGCHLLPPDQGSQARKATPEGEVSASAQNAAGKDHRFEAVNGLEPMPALALAAGGRAPLAGHVPTTFPDPPPSSRPLVHSFQAGGVAGTGTGFSAQLVSRTEGFQVSHALAVLSGSASGSRTLLLMGAGLPVPLPAALDLTAEGVAGADALTRGALDLRPALGARLGLEWSPPWSRGASASISLTGLVDLFHGGLASPACLYVTLGAGARPRREASRLGAVAAVAPAP